MSPSRERRSSIRPLLGQNYLRIKKEQPQYFSIFGIFSVGSSPRQQEEKIGTESSGNFRLVVKTG